MSCALRSVSRAPAACSCCSSSASLACIPPGSLYYLTKKQQASSEGRKHGASGFADELMTSGCKFYWIDSTVNVQPYGLQALCVSCM